MIDAKTVEYVARLARLRLNEQEHLRYREQLAAILTYIETLNGLDTAHTEPTSHVSSGLENVYRDDVARGCLPVADVLSNAPGVKGAFFKIPKVIEGK